MENLAVLRKQVVSIARAIDSTEKLLARKSGDRAVLEADLNVYRAKLLNIDGKLWKTSFYPCACGRRMSDCPNSLGGMCCNLLDKKAA
ncbi:MAG TPA: hypothetical protein V6C82_04220 [Chroococcales cyanobacterium]|jgi:hypothetical protein